MNKILNKIKQSITTWPWRLTGPIFDKELRVASRRPRNFLVRFAYLILLTVVVMIVWFSTVDYTLSGSSAYIASRMAQAGTAIISSIVAFQFFAAQILIIIMLSNAVSDEIHHQTLGLLMTTPITSLQIVFGKLLSKLLQILLLIAISLPLLAVVRVFGGVPWDFLISGLCITLTAVIFAGALSLTCSVSGRRAYAVIIKTAFILGILYAFFPALMGATFYNILPRKILITSLCYLNPFGALFNNINLMNTGRPMFGVAGFHWPIHCVIMLALSSILLACAVAVVRKTAMLQATGQLKLKYRRPSADRKNHVSSNAVQKPAGKSRRDLMPADDPLRPVKGSPIVWKELRTPFIQGGRKITIDALFIAAVVLIITYVLNINYLKSPIAHMVYAGVFFILGLAYTLVVAATSITIEKETRSWPILLTTSLRDKQILIGKTVGVLRRCLPVWLFLIAHLLLFTLIGWIHPIGALLVASIMIAVVILITGAGIYFSARFRRTTAAVVANIALVLILWLLAPAILAALSSFTKTQKPANLTVVANPLVQVDVIMDATGGVTHADYNFKSLSFRWPPYKTKSAVHSAKLITGINTIYIALGLIFLWRAKKHLRKNIF